MSNLHTKPDMMKRIIPILLALASLMLAATIANAQQRVYNPHLPEHLVFQWKFSADQVDPSWSNDQFSAIRTAKGINVFYGAYATLEEALADAENIQKHSNGTVELVPFFNQRSIGTADALALLGNHNHKDQGLAEAGSEVVSFTVYFGTYEHLLSKSELEGFAGELSFEVNPNHTFAYAWGNFDTRSEADEAMAHTIELGFESAKVQQYLNGQKVAMVDMEELYAYVRFQQQANF